MKLHHVALAVRDIERSIEWYGHFGFTENARWQANDGSLTIVQLRGQIGGIELFSQPDIAISKVTDVKAGDIEKTGLKHFCLEPDSLDDTLTHLASVGLKPVAPPKTARSMPVRYVFFRDPDGNWVELLAEA